jgi:hypothetical protein
VAEHLGEVTVRLLADEGSVPGPTLRVRQGSELVVHAVNEGDLEATVHGHGLRLENRYDGTHATQAPMPAGGAFTYSPPVPGPGRLPRGELAAQAAPGRLDAEGQRERDRRRVEAVPQPVPGMERQQYVG